MLSILGSEIEACRWSQDKRESERGKKEAGAKERGKKEGERDLWSGLKTFSCDVAGQPRQTDLSSTEVCLVVSLLNVYLCSRLQQSSILRGTHDELQPKWTSA